MSHTKKNSHHTNPEYDPNALRGLTPSNARTEVGKEFAKEELSSSEVFIVIGGYIIKWP